MDLSAEYELDVPAWQTWAAITDFEGFQQRAQERGGRLSRVDTLSEAGRGMAWDSAFVLRGREREARLEVTRWQADESFDLRTVMGGVIADATVTVEPRGDRSLLRVDADLTSRNLTGRLMVQSLKLARGNVEAQFAKRVRQLGERIERGDI